MVVDAAQRCETGPPEAPFTHRAARQPERAHLSVCADVRARSASTKRGPQ